MVGAVGAAAFLAAAVEPEVQARILDRLAENHAEAGIIDEEP